MQGGIIGSIYFLAFLLSFGIAQNPEEFKTGMYFGLQQEDEFESNDRNIYSIHIEEHDNADKRSSLFTEPNLILYPNNYGTLVRESSLYPSNPLELWNGIATNYGESHALSQAQNIASDYSSKYAKAEADANAQALAELSTNNSPYNTAYLGESSNLAQAQADTQVNAILNFGPSNLNPSYITNLAQAQGIASNLGSSYIDAEADALAQAIISGLNFKKHDENDKQTSSTFGSDSLAHYQANVQAQTQANPQKQAFSSGVSSGLAASAEADAHAQANASRGSGLESSPIGSEYLDFGLSSADAKAQSIASNLEQGLSSTSFTTQPKMGSDGTLDFGQESIFGNAHASAHAHAFSSEESGSLAATNAFAGTQSRVIPHDEYVLPHVISGGESIICSKVGELHNVRTEGYECLICACVSEYLSPVCVKCDLCIVPTLIPPSLILLEPPSPSTPLISEPMLEPEVRCDPLPTNTPFQNPLNPCQICICQYSFGLQPDVRITCEESSSCATPNDLVIIPSIPDPPAPVPMPTCERFPPNVIFPHPFDICQSCECVLSDNSLSEHKIVCYPTPGCEPISAPSPTPLPAPEPLPWPPVPAGPLPGPPPHKSCAPYPPNQQFQHPWDDCQICVCNEIYSIDVINIEVNCFTNPVCCRDSPGAHPQPLPMKETLQVTMESLPQAVAIQEAVSVPYLVDHPVSVPHSHLIPVQRPVGHETVSVMVPQHMSHPFAYPHPVTIQQPYPVDRPVALPVVESVSVPVQHEVSVVISQPKLLDPVCQFREIGEEFQYSKCRICSCQIFGSVLVPVCRRPNRPECVTLPAAVPVGNVVYIEPRCRYRQPLQVFMFDCQSCVCQSVFNYVVARCNIMPGCGQSQYSGNLKAAEANAIANGQTRSFSNHIYGYGHSQSSAEAAAAAFSGSSGSSFAEAEASANVQSNSKLHGLTPYFNTYPYYGDHAQVAAEAEAVGVSSFYPSLYPETYGQISPLFIPGGTFGHAHSLSEATADSHANALGFNHGLGHLGGRPRIKSGNAENEETEESR